MSRGGSPSHRRRVSDVPQSSTGHTQTHLADPSYVIDTPGLDPLTTRASGKLARDLLPASLQAQTSAPPDHSSAVGDTIAYPDNDTNGSDSGMEEEDPPMTKRGPPRVGILKKGGRGHTTKTPVPVKVEEVEPDMQEKVCQ